LIFLSYCFIGWIAYLIFKDLKRHLGRIREKPVKSILLSSEDDEKLFNGPEIILGRDPACGFPISDDAVSLRHCKLSYHHTHWWVEDLDSTNGSYLEESLIKSPTVLTEGDTIKIGRTEIKIKFS
jgi:pSer/pThr/pTyr-binding forkhead associated (FHA) protein